MPICVHCSTPTESLFISYGPQHLVCTRCKACGAFADPYVEHEAIIVVIDLILVKPRAYRHILFNRTDVFSDHYSKINKGKNLKPQEYAKLGKAWLLLGRRFLALLMVDAYLRWFYLCDDDKGNADDQKSRFIALWSYFNILQSTFAVTLTLHSTVLILSTIYHWIVSRIVSSKIDQRLLKIDKNELDRFKIHLLPNSLLLANLTPTFLLCLLLLWQPLSNQLNQDAFHKINQDEKWQWNEASIDWAIRTLVSGLSAGVGLGVVLPLQRTKIGALMATLILMTGWYLQFLVSQKLGMPFHSGVGVIQSSEGQLATQKYCQGS